MNEGRIGQWTTVAVQLPPSGSASLDHESTAANQEPEPVVEDTEDTRGWRLDGSKRRRIAIGLGDIYDPGEIKVKRKEGESPAPPPDVKADVDPAGSGATILPSWTPRTWAKPSESSSKKTEPKIEGDDAIRSPGAEPIKAKIEEDSIPNPLPSGSANNIGSSPIVVKKEEEVPSPPTLPAPETTTGLFRKRKAPSASASSRGSRR